MTHSNIIILATDEINLSSQEASLAIFALQIGVLSPLVPKYNHACLASNVVERCGA